MDVMPQPYGHGYRFLAGSSLEACLCSGAVRRKALIPHVSNNTSNQFGLSRRFCEGLGSLHPAARGVS